MAKKHSTMDEADNILSVDQTTRLLRLYLSWPVHVEPEGESEGESEAKEFYDWLASELDENSLAEITGGIGGVEQFLKVNTDVVSAGRQLKYKDSDKTVNAREEPRVSTSTPVFLVVYDCDKAPLLEGVSLNGMMVDMASNGMRLESDIAIPAGSIVTMTVVAGAPDSLYHLTGEVRWVSHTKEINHMGLSIFNIEDYEKWRKHFSSSLGRAL